MYHIFFIIFILSILFILLQSNKSGKWENIQNNDNYFLFFGKNDFKFRNCLGIKDCKQKYIDSELELSPNEKKNLNEIFKKFNSLINYKFRNIFDNMSIIKVKNNIENGMPHTRERNIILPQSWIDRGMDNNNLDFLKLISHEQFHIYQRYNKTKITNFYLNNWKLEKLNKKLPKELLEINRTNPDALNNYNLLFRREKDLILPICLYRKNATSLIDTENIYLRLDNNHNFIDLVDDLENRKKLSNDKEFIEFFGGESSNNYHPNEISASFFELIIEDIITKNDIIRSPAYQEFKKYLKLN
uniref:Uncharacterized protein n=1 Tax=viral metagenome TaxID=1070528 RepID=A0A6C0J660_9ZZZZ